MSRRWATVSRLLAATSRSSIARFACCLAMVAIPDMAVAQHSCTGHVSRPVALAATKPSQPVSPTFIVNVTDSTSFPAFAPPVAPAPQSVAAPLAVPLSLAQVSGSLQLHNQAKASSSKSLLSWSRHLVLFPVTIGQFFILLFLTIIATVLALIPPYRFVRHGWELKRKQVLNMFDSNTCALYFFLYWNVQKISSKSVQILNNNELFVWQLGVDKFGKNITISDDRRNILSEELTKIYNSYFGRRQYIFAMIFLFIVMLCAISLVIRSSLFYTEDQHYRLPIDMPHILLNPVAMLGAAGAYLWIVSDGISRMRVNDYLPSNIYFHTLRMFISVPMGFAFSDLANASVAGFAAFAIGVFPIEVAIRYTRISLNKILHVENDPDTDGDEIKRLIGVNADVAQRLTEEQINTILELSKCDPIRVMMRTNLDFDVVIDLMNQAIVACAVSTISDNTIKSTENARIPILEALRISGLARASQIHALMDSKQTKRRRTRTLIRDAAKRANLTEAQLRNLVRGILNDEKTGFIVRAIAPCPRD